MMGWKLEDVKNYQKNKAGGSVGQQPTSYYNFNQPYETNVANGYKVKQTYTPPPQQPYVPQPSVMGDFKQYDYNNPYIEPKAKERPTTSYTGSFGGGISQMPEIEPKQSKREYYTRNLNKNLSDGFLEKADKAGDKVALAGYGLYRGTVGKFAERVGRELNENPMGFMFGKKVGDQQEKSFRYNGTAGNYGQVYDGYMNNMNNLLKQGYTEKEIKKQMEYDLYNARQQDEKTNRERVAGGPLTKADEATANIADFAGNIGQMVLTGNMIGGAGAAAKGSKTAQMAYNAARASTTAGISSGISSFQDNVPLDEAAKRAGINAAFMGIANPVEAAAYNKLTGAAVNRALSKGAEEAVIGMGQRYGNRALANMAGDVAAMAATVPVQQAMGEEINTKELLKQLAFSTLMSFGMEMGVKGTTKAQQGELFAGEAIKRIDDTLNQVRKYEASIEPGKRYTLDSEYGRLIQDVETTKQTITRNRHMMDGNSYHAVMKKLDDAKAELIARKEWYSNFRDDFNGEMYKRRYQLDNYPEMEPTKPIYDEPIQQPMPQANRDMIYPRSQMPQAGMQKSVIENLTPGNKQMLYGGLGDNGLKAYNSNMTNQINPRVYNDVFSTFYGAGAENMPIEMVMNAPGAEQLPTLAKMNFYYAGVNDAKTNEVYKQQFTDEQRDELNNSIVASRQPKNKATEPQKQSEPYNLSQEVEEPTQAERLAYERSMMKEYYSQGKYLTNHLKEKYKVGKKPMRVSVPADMLKELQEMESVKTLTGQFLKLTTDKRDTPIDHVQMELANDGFEFVRDMPVQDFLRYVADERKFAINEKKVDERYKQEIREAKEHVAVAEKQEAPQQQKGNKVDRDTISLDRVNRETNKMEKVIFKRGETVKIFMGKDAKGNSQYSYGPIDGIINKKTGTGKDGYRTYIVSGGLEYDAGSVYKYEAPQEAPQKPKDTMSLDNAIERANKKGGKVEFTEADRVPEQPKEVVHKTYDEAKEVMRKLNRGESTTVAEVKAAHKYIKENEAEVKAALKKHTVAELKRIVGPYNADGKKKAELVDAAYNDLFETMLYRVKEDDGQSMSVTVDFGSGKRVADVYKERLEKRLAEITQEQLDEKTRKRNQQVSKYVEDRKAKVEAIKEPTTIDEFKEAKKYRELTVDEKRKLDQLVTEKDIADKAAKKEQIKNQIKEANSNREVENIKLPGVEPHTITKEQHTKTGADMWVLRWDNQLDTETYKKQVALVKSMGAYKSSFAKGMIFNQNPANVPGAVFKEADSVEPTKLQDEVKATQAPHDKLRVVADNMQSEIDGGRADRKTNTYKRATEAAYAAEKADKKEELQNVVYEIANRIEAGENTYLGGINAVTQVENIMSVLNTTNRKYLETQGDYYKQQQLRQDYDAKGYPVEIIDDAKMPTIAERGWMIEDIVKVADKLNVSGVKYEKNRLLKLAKETNPDELVKYGWRDKEDIEKVIEKVIEASGGKKDNLPGHTQSNLLTIERLKAAGIETNEHLRMALRELHGIINDTKVTKTPEQIKQEKIKKLENELVNNKIQSFFPTPTKIVDQMLEIADIKPGEKVLEPSAGSGDIADKVGIGNVDVVEYNYSLRELLELKGHKVVGSDALEVKGKYDKIIMNPPFEKKQDIQHVTHAFNENLEPGGRVVAIMSNHFTFANDKESVAFRNLVDEYGVVEPLPENSFKDSKRSTGVNTVMVTLDKPVKAKPVAKDPVKTMDINRYNESTQEWEDQSFKIGTQVSAIDKKKGKIIESVVIKELGEDVYGKYMIGDDGNRYDLRYVYNEKQTPMPKAEPVKTMAEDINRTPTKDEVLEIALDEKTMLDKNKLGEAIADLEKKIPTLPLNLQFFAKQRLKEYKSIYEEMKEKGVSEETIKKVKGMAMKAGRVQKNYDKLKEKYKDDVKFAREWQKYLNEERVTKAVDKARKPLETKIDKLETKLDRQKRQAELQKTFDDAAHKEKIKEVKLKHGEQIQKLNDKHTQALTRQKEKQHKLETKVAGDKLLQRYKKINERDMRDVKKKIKKLKTINTKYLNPAIKHDVDVLIRSLSGKTVGGSVESFMKIKDQLNILSQDDFFYVGILESIRDINKFGDTDMTKDEFDATYDMITTLVKLDKKNKEIMKKGRTMQIKELAEATKADIVNYGKMRINGPIEAHVLDMLNIRSLAAVAEGTTKGQKNIKYFLHDRFTQSHNVKYALERDIYAFLKHNFKTINWGEIETKKYTIETDNGPIEISSREKIFIALNSFNEKNRFSLIEGGVNKRRTDKKGDRSHEVLYKYSDEAVDKVVADLTPSEKKLMDTIFEFYATYSADGTNEVFMRVYDRKIATEPWYYPKNTSSEYLDKRGMVDDVNVEGMQNGLVNMSNNMRTMFGQGRFKEKHMTKTPLEYIDPLEQLMRSINDLTDFVAYAEPLRDAQRFWKEIKGEVRTVVGKETYKHINTYLKEFLTPTTTKTSEDKFWHNLLSNSGTAVFGLNPTTMAVQTLGGLNLSLEIEPKYISKAILNLPKYVKSIDDIHQYAPYLWHRSQGNVFLFQEEENLRRQIDTIVKNKKSWKQQITKGITKVDMGVCYVAWGAAYEKVKATMPHLQEGSVEFKQKVGEMTTDNVLNSQSSGEITHTSAFMRDKTWMKRAFTFAQMQNNISFNQVFMAMKKTVETGKIRYGIGALGVVVLNAVLSEIIKDPVREVVYGADNTLIDHLQREEYEEAVTKLVRRSVSSIANTDPYVGFAVDSLMETYDRITKHYSFNTTQNILTQSIMDIFDGSVTLVVGLSKINSGERYKSGKNKGELKAEVMVVDGLEKMIGTLLKLQVGIPYDNAKKISTGILKMVGVLEEE